MGAGTHALQGAEVQTKVNERLQKVAPRRFATGVAVPLVLKGIKTPVAPLAVAAALLASAALLTRPLEPQRHVHKKVFDAHGGLYAVAHHETP